MSTNYGRGDGPDNRNRTTAPSGNGNPTEPIADSHPTKPIRGANQTEWERPAPSKDWDNTIDNSSEPAQTRRRPRVGTIVWGLIVIALAVVLILAELATLNLDMGQVMIGLLIGAGLALVVGGVISASNREKDDKYPYEAGN